MEIHGIAHTGICVTNLEKSIAFYNGIMGFKIMDPPCSMVDDPDEGIALGFSKHSHRICLLEVKQGHYLELMEFGYPLPENRNVALMNQIGKHHMSYIVDDINSWVQKFRDMGLKVNSDPLPYETKAGIEWWTIVKDPDGIEIELIEKSKDSN